MSIAVKYLLEFGPFRLDPEQRLLMRDQEVIPLSPKAFDLLLVLVQRSGQVVLKDELMRLLWPDTFVEESNLGQHVFQLRKLMGERAQDASYIVTVPGSGYRFAHRVTKIPVNANEESPLESQSRPHVVGEEENQTKRPVPRVTWLRRIKISAVFILFPLLVIGLVLLTVLTPQPKIVLVRQITHSGRIEPYGQVLSDGPRLYFTERIGGIGALAEVAETGGEPTLVSISLPSVAVYDIDLARSRLLVGSQSPDFNRPLWVVPTSGGSSERIGDVLASEAVAWASDGHRIFYGNDSQIYVVEAEGGDPVKLLTAPGNITSLAVSPDGAVLRLTVRDPSSGGTSLWESAADGRNLHPLFFALKTPPVQWGEGECCGEWSPDGRYFVFHVEHEGMESFWAIREKRSWLGLTGRAAVQLYTTPDHIGAPRFSPDGKKIFFVNYKERRELVRYDPVRKLFVPYLGGIPARFLSFSADGKWVAYRIETDGTLWRSRVDGTEKLQLTFPPLVAHHSSWSPDGKRIVFGAHPPGGPSRLYWVEAAGGKPEALTSREFPDSQPSWSPDGRFIAFQERNQDETGSRHSVICVLDVGTRETRVLPGSKNFDGVHWSPDGKYAAASDQANHKLMLFEFARERWSELADGTPYGWGIRWSSDSRYVYYQHTDQAEEQPIFRVRISDHMVEQITSARQILRADVLGYSMTGLAPDNSPLASLIRKNSDIYVMQLDLP